MIRPCFPGRRDAVNGWRAADAVRKWNIQGLQSWRASQCSAAAEFTLSRRNAVANPSNPRPARPRQRGGLGVGHRRPELHPPSVPPLSHTSCYPLPSSAPRMPAHSFPAPTSVSITGAEPQRPLRRVLPELNRIRVLNAEDARRAARRVIGGPPGLCLFTGLTSMPLTLGLAEKGRRTCLYD